MRVQGLGPGFTMVATRRSVIFKSEGFEFVLTPPGYASIVSPISSELPSIPADAFRTSRRSTKCWLLSLMSFLPPFAFRLAISPRLANPGFHRAGHARRHVARLPMCAQEFATQNSSRNDNCRSRLSFTVLVICPAAGEPMAALGKPKFGVLKALNASSRTCSRRFSRSDVFLIIERSQFNVPGPYSTPRPALPYVYVRAGGLAKHAILNHSAGSGLGRFPPHRRLGQLGAPLLTP